MEEPKPRNLLENTSNNLARCVWWKLRCEGYSPWLSTDLFYLCNRELHWKYFPNKQVHTVVNVLVDGKFVCIVPYARDKWGLQSKIDLTARANIVQGGGEIIEAFCYEDFLNKWGNYVDDVGKMGKKVQSESTQG